MSIMTAMLFAIVLLVASIAVVFKFMQGEGIGAAARKIIGVVLAIVVGLYSVGLLLGHIAAPSLPWLK